MKKVIYYCDKCGKKLDEHDRATGGKYDLCEDCADKLEEHIERFFEDAEVSRDDA